MQSWLRIPDWLSRASKSVFGFFGLTDNSGDNGVVSRKSYMGATPEIHEDIMFDFMMRRQQAAAAARRLQGNPGNVRFFYYYQRTLWWRSKSIFKFSFSSLFSLFLLFNEKWKEYFWRLEIHSHYLPKNYYLFIRTFKFQLRLLMCFLWTSFWDLIV